MLYPCSPKQKNSTRKKLKRLPAEKPRQHQWWCHARKISGLFVCGRCKAGFKYRHSAKRHRKTCQGKYQRELERFTISLKDKRTLA